MKVTLLIGCNLGDKDKNMFDVLSHIENKIGVILKKSSIYRSEPWGFDSDDIFSNQAIVCETMLLPEDLLQTIWSIEKSFGKERGDIECELAKYKAREKGEISYKSREMDIDIIFYGDTIYNSDILKIPHPLYKIRDFVLNPLCEIMGDYYPVNEKNSISQLRDNLKEDSGD